MRLVVIVGAVVLGLLAAAPAQAAGREFGATYDQLNGPTPSEGADDCAGGCFFASEPEHSFLNGSRFQPPGENAKFPIRIDRAIIRR